MKLSVVTISYNAADTIEETIQSVLAQSYSPIEYIVIDGGSTDGTLDIINRYASRIDVLVSEPDEGVYFAMNKGVARATGELVAILNADDVFAHEEVLANAVNMMKAENSDVLYGDLNYLDRMDSSKIHRQWKSGPFEAKKFKWGWMPPHPSLIVKRELYTSFGAFNTELRTSADYELMLRFMYKHRVAVSYMPEVMVLMKVGGQSNASLKNRLKANQEDRMAWRLNGLKPFVFTRALKPLRKITQFFGN